MEAKPHKPKLRRFKKEKEKSWVWVSPDGDWQAGAPLSFFSQAGRQVLSTLFNQVSIKAKRDPSAPYSGGFTGASLQSDSDTAVWDPSNLHLDRESGSGKKNNTLKCGKWGGGGWHEETMNLITKCSLQETPRSGKRKWNKGRWLTQGFLYVSIYQHLIQLWTCSFLALSGCNTGCISLSN